MQANLKVAPEAAMEYLQGMVKTCDNCEWSGISKCAPNGDGSTGRLGNGSTCRERNLWTPDGGLLVDNYLGVDTALELICHKAARPDLLPMLRAALSEMQAEAGLKDCTGNS